MKISALEAYGIDQDVLSIWKSSGHDELLPIQETAIRQGKVLEGKNVVVFSPTSSGKTFVGEMVAVRLARRRQRVVFLVPQKALAEEKCREFRRLYAGLGIRVVISTRDHNEYDADIRNGLFHIAIVVYEKMQGLLVVSPQLISKLGAVIIDELQMIADRSRGADLEILLTKIKASARKAQIIGLSAALGDSERLARWLDARLCTTNTRPVELRKGVLCQGVFRYVEHNSGEQGQEEFGVEEGAQDRGSMLVNQVCRFATAGESCLIFCKTKQECLTMGERIAYAISLSPAEKALGELHPFEECGGKDALVRLLERGVAYHNADLDWDHRDIVERYFRKGEIKVICATSTLAMGLNLPARNVFLDDKRWERDAFGNWSLENISIAEYENMSGRAGRFGLEKDFGRSILVTDSPFDSRAFLDVYTRGQLVKLDPALTQETIAHHVLNLVASRICTTEEALAKLLLDSFTGQLLLNLGDRNTQFKEQIAQGIRQCLDGELLRRNGDVLTATKLGRIAAVKGLAVDSAIKMATFAKVHCDRAPYVTPFEVILCLSKTDDGDEIHFNLSTEEYETDRYLDMLKAVVMKQPPASRRCLAAILRIHHVEYDRAKRAKKALIIHDWVSGVSTREIEKRYRCLSGSIIGLATEYSWLAEAFAFVAKHAGWPLEDARRMLSLAERILHGVPQEASEIARARVRGVGRGRAMLLAEHGLESIEKIVAAPQEMLAKLVGKTVAGRLLKRASDLLLRKEVLSQAVSRSLGVPSQPIAAETKPRQTKTPPSWVGEFPLSDELGEAYKSGVRVHIDGRCEKRRYLVTLDDHECWLGESAFRGLLQLAVAAQRGGLAWLPFDRLGTPDTYHQVVRRMKRDLKVEGVDINGLIENNRSKQYRLSVPAKNVTHNREMILLHCPEAQSILPELPTEQSADKMKKVAG